MGNCGRKWTVVRKTEALFWGEEKVVKRTKNCNRGKFLHIMVITSLIWLEQGIQIFGQKLF